MLRKLLTIILLTTSTMIAVGEDCADSRARDVIESLASCPSEICKARIDSLYLYCGDAELLKSISREADERWGDPDAPTYDEAKMALFYEAEATSPLLEEWERQRANILLQRLLRNAPGTQANDFSFTLADGTESTLYEQLAASDRPTLLIFYDPECDDCNEAKRIIAQSPEYLKFNVLAIYDGGEDDMFRGSLAEMPSGWTVGDSHALIEASEIYDFMTMPTIYKLSPDGKVLVKNMKVSEFFDAEK